MNERERSRVRARQRALPRGTAFEYAPTEVPSKTRRRRALFFAAERDRRTNRPPRALRADADGNRKPARGSSRARVHRLDDAVGCYD